ncbi:MAG: hypothetical protein PHI31_11315 [Desulfuromonadaceae bacterium]|nr:hypothetical protein [Desulfuromonadaceae bacterium]
MKQPLSSKTVPLFLLFLIASGTMFFAGTVFALEISNQGENHLRSIYQQNTTRLDKSSFGLPLFLDSFERDNRVHVDVYGIFNSPFTSIADVLKIPANWCDIVSIHPNVKSCTYGGVPGSGQLTFYVGKKTYQPPEDTRHVVYQYRTVTHHNSYMDTILSADSGPFGTEGHIMRFEAMPLAGGRTFVHVSYEYSDSVALRLAAKVYFATIGRDKVGFTETGTDDDGKPTYIGGPRGSIERNAVRYYFAIQSFMNTQSSAEKNRFKVRISDWYDRTSHYPKQLFDLDRKDYLAFKTSEHGNQLMLQQKITTPLQ